MKKDNVVDNLIMKAIENADNIEKCLEIYEEADKLSYFKRARFFDSPTGSMIAMKHAFFTGGYHGNRDQNSK